MGQARTWRVHIRGAWNLLQSFGVKNHWNDTDFTRISAQSLHIIKILGETSEYSAGRPDLGTARPTYQDMDQSMLSSVSSTEGFGFTLGASKEILECIASITALEIHGNRKETYDCLDEDVTSILAKLSKFWKFTSTSGGGSVETQPGEDQDSKECTDVHDQKMAFVFATYIHLYRTIYKLPPVRLRYYVRKTFEHVQSFFRTSDGNFSVWPAFIAAVEAYADQDIASARMWLDRSTKFGMANRNALRKVVEEVWRRREDSAASLGTDPGSIAVDWRQVMEQLHCDVLLV